MPKRSGGAAITECGPCPKCGGQMSIGGEHNCKQLKREKEKSEKEASKSHAKHRSVNDKLKKRPPPPPPPSASGGTASQT